MANMTFEVSSRYQFGDCRDGFNHFGYLYIDGVMVSQSKCHYINRTWEVYAGQSARRAAAYNWMQSHEEDVKEAVKERMGLKRATPRVKEAVAAELRKDAKYQAVKSHYESL